MASLPSKDNKPRFNFDVEELNKKFTDSSSTYKDKAKEVGSFEWLATGVPDLKKDHPTFSIPVIGDTSGENISNAKKTGTKEIDGDWWAKYEEESDNVAEPRGLSERGKSLMKNQSRGKFYGSLVNKVHLIRVSNGLTPDDKKAYKRIQKEQAQTFFDLCERFNGNVQYDADDFLYCKNIGLPLNRMITLRRYPHATTDNIFDRFNQAQPDIARLVTFFTEDVNRLEDILSFSFGLRWKELTAEMEQHNIEGDQTGLTGFMGRVMKYIDPVLAQNVLRGEPSKNFNPMYDQNKVYGPVDSINSTHIRDVGFDFNKEFTLIFEYDANSYSGRTPEYAMRDILANVLAVTYNNGKFWGGARFWVGDRPTQYLSKFQGILNPLSVSQWVEKMREGIGGVIAQFSGGAEGSKIQAMKNAMKSIFSTVAKNAMAVGLGMILDKVGRASIITSNSLLSGEPIGNWHLTIGHPENPIMCIGNLLCMGVDIKFPTDELSYGDFPTKLMVEIRLKPAMAKDKAGIEMMFNMGKQRIYHNPKKIKLLSAKSSSNLAPSQRTKRVYDETVDNESILQTFNETFDYTPLEQKGDKLFNKNVELMIDGQDYTSNKDYDKDLLDTQNSYTASQLKEMAEEKGAYARLKEQAESRQNTMSGGYAGGTGAQNTAYGNSATPYNPNLIPNNTKGNVDKSKITPYCNYVTNHANPKPTGYCSKSVRIALQQCGVPVKHTKQAKDMHRPLMNVGFKQLPLNTQPQVGDICVLNAVGRHIDGHIAIWNGTQWVSDFKQKGLNVWRDIPPNQVTGAIYRP